MERRDFLKLAFGFAAGAATLAASAQAAPLLPQPLPGGGRPSANSSANEDAHPAVTTGEEVDRLKPEEVRWGHHGWGHHGHRHWGHRHWGWHRRHWGWRHRWHRHHWHRRHW
jgi:hypothetical protein